eukprot:CAMPEP_0115066762 /NCGR_PEP_ID=MMETSP0227-20121206/10996_1 /TAXON_ID=89957 /ORGANISM="Polarella glacialis, Strain CCMP 1383" /LENGTH=683 /DNA_ID=CAMNT_0002452717 /DNA_START=102 /DNA_END=2153 /DNA_ORIENTATION=-
MGSGTSSAAQAAKVQETAATTMPATTPAVPTDDLLPKPSAGKLPLQLDRLPNDSLCKVAEALVTLQSVGLQGIPNLASLQEVVAARQGKPSLPVSDFTSEYMGMNLWAWSRNLWNAAVGKVSLQPIAGGPSNDQPKDVAAPEPETEAARNDLIVRAKMKFDKLQARLMDMGDKSREACEPWFEAMVTAGKQVTGFASLAADTKSSDRCGHFRAAGLKCEACAGDGLGVLFEKMAGHPGPSRALLPLKVTTRPVSTTFSGATAATPKTPSAIMLHIGGQGCGMGLASWQQLLGEHCLGGDGRLAEDGGAVRGAAAVHFAESRTGHFVPRAVFASFGSDGLSAVRKAGPFAPLDQLEFPTRPDMNWHSGARGPDLGTRTDQFMEAVRRQAEQADYVHSFILTNSLHEDGPASGFCEIAMQKLGEQFGKKLKWAVVSTPAVGGAAAAEEPTKLFNAACSFKYLMEDTDLVSFVDRPSLLFLDADNPLGLVGRVVSAFTSPLRLAASGNARVLSMKSMTTNLVPYPRLHFVIPSLPLLKSQELISFLQGSMSSGLSLEGKYLAATMLTRGLPHFALLDKIMEQKKSSTFSAVDWNPQVFALGSHQDPSVMAEGEVVCLHNHTSTASMFTSWLNGVENVGEEVLRKHRDEGLDHDEMIETKEDIQALITDYTEVAIQLQDEEEEEEEY